MIDTYKYDVVLVGAGIMSTTVALNLKLLFPSLEIMIVEKLPQSALESSGALNNAGTGHAGFCELNFTPELEDGSIDITKALKINEAFQLSKQFWSYLITEFNINKEFIHQVPHMSYVEGEKDIEFLRKRFQILKRQPLFDGLNFNEVVSSIYEMIPLMKQNKPWEFMEPVAVTRYEKGADMNYEILTREMIKVCQSKGVEIVFDEPVLDIEKNNSGWFVKTKKYHFDSKFVFIGAGGNSIKLLEKTKLKESYGHGGFPVSGEFFICENPEIVNQHQAKVYGKAKIGAPPMSVPHLDTRVVNGKKVLLFGPYAGFTMKFLKSGSKLDLLKSITIHNIWTMISAGLRNVGLTKYLIKEVLKSENQKFEELKEFYPKANKADWKLIKAGQRVQVIKKNEKNQGVIEFGTEIITSPDKTLVALLGASPGASTSVDIALKIIENCFNLAEAKKQIKDYIPSYGQKLNDNPELFKAISNNCNKILGLNVS